MVMNSRNALTMATTAVLMELSSPAHADGLLEEPLPRFEDRMCPGVAGIQDVYAEELVFRIRANAESVGVSLADPESCEPNVIIAFVEDGGEYLTDMASKSSFLFDYLGLRDREALLAQTGPARAWIKVSPRTRDGNIVGIREDASNIPQAGMWQAHSRIYRAVRNDITYAMVLFDRSAVAGLTLTQLADYASLRVLATEYPRPENAEDVTILSLFDNGAQRPAGLTDRDRAWLGRLYSGVAGSSPSVRGNNLADASGVSPN